MCGRVKLSGVDDLTPDGLAAIISALRRAIDEDGYEHSPRRLPLKSALAKLDPSGAAKPSPPPNRRGMRFTSLGLTNSRHRCQWNRDGDSGRLRVVNHNVTVVGRACLGREGQ